MQLNLSGVKKTDNQQRGVFSNLLSSKEMDRSFYLKRRGIPIPLQEKYQQNQTTHLDGIPMLLRVA